MHSPPTHNFCEKAVNTLQQYNNNYECTTPPPLKFISIILWLIWYNHSVSPLSTQHPPHRDIILPIKTKTISAVAGNWTAVEGGMNRIAIITIYKYTYHGKHKPWGADKGGLELLLQIKWQIEKVAMVGAPIALRGSSVLACCCPLPDTGIAYYYLRYVYLSCIVLLHSSSNSNNDYTHTQIHRGCGWRLNRVPNDDDDANDCGTMQKYCDYGKAYTCCTIAARMAIKWKCCWLGYYYIIRVIAQFALLISTLGQHLLLPE